MDKKCSNEKLFFRSLSQNFTKINAELTACSKLIKIFIEIMER